MTSGPVYPTQAMISALTRQLSNTTEKEPPKYKYIFLFDLNGTLVELRNSSQYVSEKNTVDSSSSSGQSKNVTTRKNVLKANATGSSGSSQVMAFRNHADELLAMTLHRPDALVAMVHMKVKPEQFKSTFINLCKANDSLKSVIHKLIWVPRMNSVEEGLSVDKVNREFLPKCLTSVIKFLNQHIEHYHLGSINSDAQVGLFENDRFAVITEEIKGEKPVAQLINVNDVHNQTQDHALGTAKQLLPKVFLGQHDLSIINWIVSDTKPDIGA